MKFGYTIIYVKDVNTSLTFFENAFGLKIRFIHESGYGEQDTGETTLAFATHELGSSNLPAGYVAADTSSQPLGIEIALVTDSVTHAHQRAITAGEYLLVSQQLSLGVRQYPTFAVRMVH